jgi:hypothetical protein
LPNSGEQDAGRETIDAQDPRVVALLRPRLENRLPQRAIAESLDLSQGAVSTYLSRARAAGVGWPIPEELDDARLEALLFPPLRGTPADQRPMPDWAWVHRCTASCAAPM